MLRLVNEVQFLTGAGAWDLRTFLENSFSTLSDWISLAVMILGLVAVGYAVWQITKGLMSQGKGGPVNWPMNIILLLVGGVLSMSTGFEFVQELASGGKETIEDLGGQTIMMFEHFKMFM